MLTRVEAGEQFDHGELSVIPHKEMQETSPAGPKATDGSGFTLTLRLWCAACACIAELAGWISLSLGCSATYRHASLNLVFSTFA